MKAVTTIHATTAEEAVTVAMDSGRNPIFSVRGGVPLSDAFDQLSLQLAAATEAVEATAAQQEDGEPNGTWSAIHNLHALGDLVQSMHSGYVRHRDQLKS